MVGRDFAAEVSTKTTYEWKEGLWGLKAADGEPGFNKPETFKYKVVAYDFGIKRNILREMAERGMEVTVVPATTPVSEVLAMNPDGVFLSTGPVTPSPAPTPSKRRACALKRRSPLRYLPRASDHGPCLRR